MAVENLSKNGSKLGKIYSAITTITIRCRQCNETTVLCATWNPPIPTDCPHCHAQPPLLGIERETTMIRVPQIMEGSQN